MRCAFGNSSGRAKVWLKRRRTSSLFLACSRLKPDSHVTMWSLPIQYTYYMCDEKLPGSLSFQAQSTKHIVFNQSTFPMSLCRTRNGSAGAMLTVERAESQTNSR